ncbi:ElaA protein [Microcella putealis]|uniref:ElaA protein n=1 Tax=Microcella putealis TaxID=337005 RepID=A0A4Q7LH98_9MICO|nr:GNAT family N-acetyltransferase [Microcella putealis]RZS53472.1 ElaA protein [Microcella putealis]TQM26916.1 ElaA protein [Microcella putealis]HET8958686.1 GNAT family N-acetyltransferase [Microcella sp.]
MPEPSIEQKTWSHISADEFFEIASLRTEVFYLEQQIDEAELDERDREPTTQHVWLRDDRGVVSYLRVIEDAHPEPSNGGARRLIGRVVTRADARGRGLALRLVEHVIAQFGDEPLALHSQSYIQPLYARAGFEPVGEEYMEAGIPHVTMVRRAGR